MKKNEKKEIEKITKLLNKSSIKDIESFTRHKEPKMTVSYGQPTKKK